MKALKNLKVIDLSQVMAGPYCTMSLADMGAEVIKVEKYPNGDDTREMGPYENGESYCYMMINRNKKGIRLNLKEPEGKEVFKKLIKEGDVLVENFRPGVVKKLGIDYETLKEINPKLIYCSISGYGQTGPYSHKGGFDIMAQGLSGIMSMTGEPDSRPAKVGIAIHDLAAALTAVNSILAAYIHRLESGNGQYIDISLVDSGLALTTWEAAAYFGAGEIPKKTGSRHRISAPYQGIKTKDGYVLVGAANQKLWEKFCENVVEKPEWIKDERFLSNYTRQQHIEDLEAMIEDIFQAEATHYWTAKMEKCGVPGGPILSYEETLQNEHVLARNMVEEVEHPIAGKMKVLGVPAKFSETPGKVRASAPTLGQHTKEVLKTLEISDEEIEELKNKHII
ncbi:CaiB/BaiF CoA transferase family protein [Alteribacillus sp. HJP-4]|uniref:CaiB/BaiF CoA transferase family protein n=1 Tax=Alteribacillus sp. HJP-4 TaxID=2775394 RepID=UPI0035CCE1FD